jgi:hypothetical protein
MIIDFCKTAKITPKGCHVLREHHVIPSGFGLLREFFYHPAIPSGLKTA